MLYGGGGTLSESLVPEREGGAAGGCLLLLPGLGGTGGGVSRDADPPTFEREDCAPTLEPEADRSPDHSPRFVCVRGPETSSCRLAWRDSCDWSEVLRGWVIATLKKLVFFDFRVGSEGWDPSTSVCR